MNKTRILIVGLATLAVASLCSAALRELPVVVPAEKVVAFDAVVDHQPEFNIAVCDVEFAKVAMTLERDAVNYVVSEQSTAGARAVSSTKASVRGRMCRQSVAASFRSKPLTDYEQRT
jgi:hypothetical protein